MRKIASPRDLQAELHRLLAYSQGKEPSREVLASELRALADRVAAKRQQLDPSKALEGNAVAYFYVGGNEHDGDPESVDLRKGDIPLKVLEKHLEKRLGHGAKVQPHGSKELECHATGHDGKPYSYITPVKVEARK
jgi:uncharacterized protein YhaN